MGTREAAQRDRRCLRSPILRRGGRSGGPPPADSRVGRQPGRMHDAIRSAQTRGVTVECFIDVADSAASIVAGSCRPRLIAEDGTVGSTGHRPEPEGAGHVAGGSTTTTTTASSYGAGAPPPTAPAPSTGRRALATAYPRGSSPWSARSAGGRSSTATPPATCPTWCAVSTTSTCSAGSSHAAADRPAPSSTPATAGAAAPISLPATRPPGSARLSAGSGRRSVGPPSRPVTPRRSSGGWTPRSCGGPAHPDRAATTRSSTAPPASGTGPPPRLPGPVRPATGASPTAHPPGKTIWWWTCSWGCLHTARRARPGAAPRTPKATPAPRTCAECGTVSPPATTRPERVLDDAGTRCTDPGAAKGNRQLRERPHEQRLPAVIAGRAWQRSDPGARLRHGTDTNR